jgi:chemotaxis protein methyltransferase CheR
MSDADFDELRRLVREVTGIALADSKRTMLSSRLASRLRTLSLPDFAAYRRRLRDPGGLEEERQALTNAVTTNKTGFFRENHHFDLLGSTLVPSWVERARRSGTREILIWSAACSTGQEPWTIAMTLAERLPEPQSWKVRVLATDIDTDVLARAEAAVYSGAELEGLSAERLSRHFDEQRGRYRLKESLRRWVSFRQLNFIDEPWPLRSRFDLILCRNASIYFEAPTQHRLFNRLCDHLVAEGWLFVGHAEVLHWMSERLEAKPGNVYRRRAGDGASASATGSATGWVPSRPRPFSAVAPSPSGAKTVRARSYHPVHDQHDQLQVVNINVGETHTSTTPVEIKTLLGSCVAACLYDPVSGIGGMNHFLLPHTAATHEIDRQRFGTHAMETLINALMGQGADRQRLQAKIFGGGNVLDGVTRRPTVGEQNGDFAKAFLEKEGIKLVSSRLGGETGVEVRFHPHSGRAFVRPIARELIDLTREEAEEMPMPGGEAELFV